MHRSLGIKWKWTMPYHPPDKWAGREITPDNCVHDQKAGRRQRKPNWPSHLAEIAHAYNATQSTVTRYNPHYLMFRWQLRLPVDLCLPTIASNEAPMREASTKCVDMYVASVRNRLRTALWEAQAQSITESCQQKWYYNRKIGAVNLKPWWPGTSEGRCLERKEEDRG